MEQTVLFRGKSINTGEWIESMTISNGTIKRKYGNCYLEIDGTWIGVYPDSVGQYTLQSDRKGNPLFGSIYINGKVTKGGDLVTHNKNTAHIEFMDGCFSIYRPTYYVTHLTRLISATVEIIGKQYEA